MMKASAALSRIVLVALCLLVSSCTREKASQEQEDAPFDAVAFVNHRMANLVEDWAECADYAGHVSSNGIDLLCRPEWAPPLAEWTSVFTMTPPRRRVASLPRDQLDLIHLPGGPFAEGELTTIFGAGVCSVWVRTFPEAGAAQGRALVDETIRILEQRGTDVSRFKKRLDDMSDLEAARAERAWKCSELDSPAENLDDALWRYYMRSVRGGMLAEDTTCREFSHGTRSVLYYATGDVSESHFLRFRVFDDETLEYEILISQVFVGTARAEEADAVMKELAVQRVRQISCGIMGLAFLGKKGQVDPDVRERFERTMGEEWTKQCVHPPDRPRRQDAR